MFETLDIQVDGKIATMTFNTPKKLNSLTSQRLVEIVQAARWFDEQSEIRVVIIRGQGRAFSAGADLSNFNQSTRTPRQNGDLGRRMADAIEEMNAVAIAAIHGWCVGGALVLASACDLRIATDDTQFSIPEVDLGIPLAWGGIPRLVREIGPALTKELVMTCRSFDAAEAKAAGFLNKVVEPERLNTEVVNLAEAVAERPLMPIQVTKRHVNAITSQMVGAMRSWSDSDGLLAGFADPECAQARINYLDSRLKK